MLAQLQEIVQRVNAAANLPDALQIIVHQVKCTSAIRTPRATS